MPVHDTGTLLTISTMGVPLYSGRGLQQSLDPIDAAANVERTVNGTLVNLAPDSFKKYKTAITCTDVAGPAIDGVFPGMTVTIECVAELTYPASGSPSRSVVSGSQVHEGNFIRYRPSLSMMITNLSTQKDEWGAVTQWEIDAEEV